MSRLSHADAAWLNMERPDNLMNINGLMFFRHAPDRERLTKVLERRLCCFERFRSRIAPGIGPPAWQLDQDFNVSRHLIFEDPLKLTTQEILERAGSMMSEPLSREHPLWEFRVFPYVEDGAVMFVRLHHAIADGIALMRVLLALCDPTSECDLNKGGGVKEERGRRSGMISQIKSNLSRFIHKSHDLLFHPEQAAELARMSVKAGQSLTRLMALPPDRQTPFKGTLGTKKKAALSPPISLAEVKNAGKKLGCTINDLLMGTLAGALRRSLLRHGNLDLESEIRVVIPVDLRGGDIGGLGNRFGLVFLALPVGLTTAKERLLMVRRHMNELKGSAEALVVFEVLSSLGMVPAELEKPIVEWFGSKATAVVTNLPGPKEKLFLAGAELDSVMYWVPQSGALALGVSILSYAGQIRLGVACDAALIPDPQSLVSDFLDEYQELVSLEVL